MKEVLQFLRELSEHNEKPWFEANKKRYLAAKERVDALAVELIAAIRAFDDTIGPLAPKDCTWRIYRDTRFSHDKRPYKTQMGVYVCRGGKKSGFSGYYFQIGAPDSGHMLAAGNYYCEPPVLKILREDILYGKGDFRNILGAADPRMVLDLSESLKRSPAGFPAEGPDAAFFKLKNFCLVWQPDDRFITDKNLVDRLAAVFQTTKPFLDYLNRAIEYSREFAASAPYDNF
ncbi:MAG: DUF2461 domain-containing protein [Bacteroidales bacterium]|nr:DUF2461 domain-containing protein [Bacteroidales bacterium]